MKRDVIGRMGLVAAMSIGYGAALRQRYDEASDFPGTEPDILIMDEAHALGAEPYAAALPKLSRQQRRAMERCARKR